MDGDSGGRYGYMDMQIWLIFWKEVLGLEIGGTIPFTNYSRLVLTIWVTFDDKREIFLLTPPIQVPSWIILNENVFSKLRAGKCK